MEASPLKLWYGAAAQDWEKEALPLGNGRLGMMAFGGVHEDKFSLNEISIWAAPDAAKKRDLSGALKKSRALLFDGKEHEAQELLQKEFMGPDYIGRYQPLGDLILRFCPAGKVTGYRRELDLESALHSVAYTAGGVNYKRRAFVSASDDVMVIELSADRPGMISVELQLEREENFECKAGEGGLRFWGQAGDKGKPQGVKFEARLQAKAKGGSVKAEGGLLKIEGADSLLLLLSAATDYNAADPLAPKVLGWEKAAQAALEGLEGYGALFESHRKAHQKLFSRVSFEIGSASELPTDERLARYKNGEPDPALEALYFQYGRYLLIGSSNGGPLPANLQGLWNKYLSPPWSADYHININLQMNYWHAEAANLAECSEPLFHFLEATRPGAREIARGMGLPGITAGHTGGAFGFGGQSGRTLWGMWVTGLQWSARHFMEHYRFGGDEKFLRDRAWPYMKEASEFMLAWLVEDPKTGKLVSGPAISPENEYLDEEGRRVNVSMGPAMDQQIAWDLFDSVEEAAAILGLKNSWVERVAAAKAKLAVPAIAKDGRLMEWASEKNEAEPGHRHISHLFGLHPGHQFSQEGSPEIWEAAKKALEYRLSHGGGHTGWSRAWIMNFWARFKDGEKAHENFRALLSKSTLPNLWDTHPPFQIDGNFGGAAAVTEMLLQSQHGELELLPALPKAWPQGEIKGLRARGGYQLDLAWSGGKLKSASIRALKAGQCRIRYAGKAILRKHGAGESFEFKP